MDLLFVLNFLLACAAFTYCLHALAHLHHISWAQWRALPWRDVLAPLGWRLGHVLLGTGGAAIMLGPLYGYVHPHVGTVFFSAGTVIVLATFHFRGRHASSSDR